MRKTVSILGCGWLGTALGKRLLSKRFVVKGSSITAEKINELETTGIEPYYVKVGTGSIEMDYAAFFNTDVLIIAIPPRRIENIEEVFPQQIQQVIQYIEKLKIQQVIFISSTSVFENCNVTVREGEEGSPNKPAGRALLNAEKMLMDLKETKTTVLRFGGLIGYNRNPARFLLGKKGVPANTPVNLIHRDDCVKIITEIIEKEVWGEVFNACSPGHPSKKDFYKRAAKIGDLPAPEFVDIYENHKIVNSDKLIKKLNYTFQYPNPMDYLKELEEWAYRI
jgi:nucleoside-diphosphate-sugar epimerase